jgi:hypothetical protein
VVEVPGVAAFSSVVEPVETTKMSKPEGGETTKRAYVNALMD